MPNTNTFAPTQTLPFKEVFGHVNFFILVFLSVLILLKAIIYFTQAENGSFTVHDISYLQGTELTHIEEIKRLPEATWLPQEKPLFQPEKGGVWAKIEFPSTVSGQDTILRITDPLIDIVDVYIIRNTPDGIDLNEQYLLGDARPFSQRVYAVPNSVVPVLKSPYKTTVYLRGETKLSLNLGVSLWKNAEFITFYDKFTLFYGMLFGYILALVCYCLMTSATARKSEYLWFCLFSICFLTHIAAMSGFGFQYVWPNSVGFQSIVGGATISLVFATLTKLTQVVLAPKTRAFNLAFTLVTSLHLCIAALASITSKPIFVSVGIVALFVSSIIPPLLCWSAKGVRTATQKLMTLIWLVFIGATIASTLDRFSIISLNIEPIFILILGFHLITLTMGFALLYEYKSNYKITHEFRESAIRDKEKAVLAKDEILKLQSESRMKLEAQVKEQTLQLEGALQDLHAASQELESMRNVDGLTSLPNRLAFEIALEKMATKLIDSGHAISIAVIDIDYFKKINDKFGHIAGDECLREFAKLIKSKFEQENYTYCRFGGEEFIIASVLPEESVIEKMNAFRLAVENMKVETGAGPISFTTSIGIASKRLHHTNELRKLTALADHNLYLAKQKGRNLVIA